MCVFLLVWLFAYSTYTCTYITYTCTYSTYTCTYIHTYVLAVYTCLLVRWAYMYICISAYLVLVHVHVSVCAVAVCTFLWLCGSCAYASACVICAIRVQYALCKHPYLCDDCVFFLLPKMYKFTLRPLARVCKLRQTVALRGFALRAVKNCLLMDS